MRKRNQALFKPNLPVFSFLLSTVLFLTGPGPVQTQEVDVNAYNFYGQTPLHRAVLNNNDEMVESLLKRGADPNKRNSAQALFPERTPLYEAVLENDHSIVRLLLKYGADPNLRTSDMEPIPGLTALFGAVGMGNLHMARILLEQGADPLLVFRGELQGNQGKTVEVTLLAHAAGYRIPGYRYSRMERKTLGNGWLHQLMLEHVRRQGNWDRLDETMRWQGKGCYGYVVERTDRKLSLIARKVYGDADRWPEIARPQRHIAGQSLPDGRLPEGV